MTRNYFKVILFFIFGLILYCLYATAHTYNYYSYYPFSMEYDHFLLKVSLKERARETYLLDEKKVTDISSVYAVGAIFYCDQQKVVDSVIFSKISIRDINGNNTYNVSTLPGVEIKKENYGRVHFGFGTIDIPKENYTDHELLIEFKVVFNDGTENNYKAKGVIETDFNWHFSWDTFDMIMSV